MTDVTAQGLAQPLVQKIFSSVYNYLSGALREMNVLVWFLGSVLVWEEVIISLS